MFDPSPRHEHLPKWLKRKIPKGNANHFTEKLLHSLHLTTVCDHAKCPNRMECYAQKTATFMLLGTVCTRNCRFCSVPSGTPTVPDGDEPGRIAEAVAKMGLSHVVLTMVSRDDLPDGGAEHFCACIEAIRTVSEATIEVLPSDFAGNRDAVLRLANCFPHVYNYNTETVPRLYRSIRGPIPNYRWTLDTFRLISKLNPKIKLKSGLMLGLGETEGEIVELLADLFHAGCQMITIGQYLRPSLSQLPVIKYLTPKEFEHFGELAKRIGFEYVAAGPFVRSSYHAAEASASLCCGQ